MLINRNYRLRLTTFAASFIVLLTVIAAAAQKFPDPLADAPIAASSAKQTAVLAGGCFWGQQLVFEHLKGVLSVTAGYSGGAANTAEYETVSSGTTGHAESVQIVFDPSQVSYGQILKVFFAVAHDPTQLDRQYPDQGTQYRSAIFYANDQQRTIAQNYIRQLDAAKVFPKPIVTEVTPLKGFYRAESYHQNYAIQHPDNPYIATYDAPKVGEFRAKLPALYVTH